MIPYSAFELKKIVVPGHAGPRRVYGTFGDAILQKRVVGSLLKLALSDEAGDFNLDTLDGEATPIVEVFARASNLPFLSDYRVVHVQRAERLEGMHRTAGSDEGEGAAAEKGKLSPARRLAQGIASLPETTVLILSRTPETPEPGSRAGTARCINAIVDKAIEPSPSKGGLIVDCTISPKDSARAVELVQREAVEHGFALGPGPARYLVERVGNDVALLFSELEKCALRAGSGVPITNAIIDEMTRRKLHETIFDLTDALGSRQGPRALGLLRELMENGEPPQRILATMVGHFRQLLQARACLDAGLSLDSGLAHRMPPDLADELPREGRDSIIGVLQWKSWIAPKLTRQARNFATPQLEAALQAALETDLAMKGIEEEGGSPDLLMELLVSRLA